MKKIIAVFAVVILATFGVTQFSSSQNLGEANKITYTPDVFPKTTSTFWVGTTSNAYKGGVFDELCLNGSCQTSWPSGTGSGGSSLLATTSADTFVYPTGGRYYSGPYFVATDTTASIFPYASTTAVSATTFFGALTGTASLATALGANGSNCSAGQFPLGVDASGASETCTDAWTEAENTSAGYTTLTGVNSYIHGSTTIPKTYTANTFTALQTTGNATTTNLTATNLWNTNASSTWVSATRFYGALTGAVTGNASTATALAANGANCTVTGQFPLGVNASGAVETCTSAILASTTTLPLVTTMTGLGTVGTAGATTTVAGKLKATEAFTLGTDYITDITGTGLTLTNGVLSATGGGGSISGWATTTSSVAGQNVIYTTLDTDIACIGGTSTTTCEFWVDPNTAIAKIKGSTGTSTAVLGTANNEWVVGTSDTDKSLRFASSTGQLDGVTSQMSLSKAGVLTVSNASTTYTSATSFFGGASATSSLPWLTTARLAITEIFQVLTNLIVCQSTTCTYTGTQDMSGATVKAHRYKGFSWPGGFATTTTATTSVAIGQAMVATNLEYATCRVTSGTGGYQFSDGTNKTTYRAASTTASRFVVTTNDTFTVDENMIMEVGPLTAAEITCGVDMIEN